LSCRRPRGGRKPAVKRIAVSGGVVNVERADIDAECVRAVYY